MADQSLTTSIFDLCLAFTAAVEQDYPKQSTEVREIIAAVGNEKLEGLAYKIVDYTCYHSPRETPSTDHAKTIIEFSEVWADLCLRGLPPEKVASYVPAELKNQADADWLHSLGAPKLASLCEFKKK